jgi:hypothetical protein
MEVCFVVVVFVFGELERTQGLTHAKQAVYH